MAGAEHFRTGNDAFSNKDYLTAKEEFSKAIECEPKKSEYLLQRSRCYAKLNDFANAEIDATKAIELDGANQDAFISQGTARYNMKKYQQAKESFESAFKLRGDDENAKTWIKKCETEIKNAEQAMQKPEAQNTSISASSESRTIRHDWYQTEQNVVVSIMMKNCKKDDVDVEFGKQTLSVSVKLPNGRNYNLELDLAHEIVVEQCIAKVLSTKIEIKMKKNEGIRWSSLEYQGEAKISQFSPQESGSADSAVRNYPSSSTKYHDWNKLAAKIEKDEENEKKEGEAALNELFQKIYRNADDDTRRAMNKSYQESGGTVLSTNWKDIGSKKVKCKPPEGMEYKKYEY